MVGTRATPKGKDREDQEVIERVAERCDVTHKSESRVRRHGRTRKEMLFLAHIHEACDDMEINMPVQRNCRIVVLHTTF